MPAQTYLSPPIFVDGGRGLITLSTPEALTLRATETGNVRLRMGAQEIDPPITSAELSPDGSHLAVISGRMVQLFEVATGRPDGPALAHRESVHSVAFNADGSALLTSSRDGNIQLWSLLDGELMLPPLNLHRGANAASFAPGGRLIATAQDGELVRIWGLPGEPIPMTRLPLADSISFAALSPDGALVIPTGSSYVSCRLSTTRASSLETGRPAGPGLTPGGSIVDASFAPDGRSVAILSARDRIQAKRREDVSAVDPQVQAWTWSTGRQLWRAPLPSDPRSLAYRPDGTRLAVLCGGGELLLFDPASGHEVNRWQAHEADPRNTNWVNNGKVRFTPDGASLVTWGMAQPDVRVWSVDTGQMRYSPLIHGGPCHDVAFAPDGHSIAVASHDGSVSVHDLATGEVVSSLPTHPNYVFAARYSPDGTMLVTACRDRKARVWDVRTRRLVVPPVAHGDEVFVADFTPDGRWVLSASIDGMIRLWDWRTGKPVAPTRFVRGRPLEIVSPPKGQRLVIGGQLNGLDVLDLGPISPTTSPDLLGLQAELLTGESINEEGGLVTLTNKEWLERWQALERRSPGALRARFLEARSPRPAPVEIDQGPIPSQSPNATGAANRRESRTSSTPPKPGTAADASLRAQSRLIMDSMRSPS